MSASTNEGNPVPAEPLPFIQWLDGMARAYGYMRDADLARGLGLPQSTVSRWRRQGARPSVEHLVKISALFRTDLVPLLALTGHANLGDDPLAMPPEPPLKPMSEVERRIRDADIPPRVRRALSRYWRQRMEEEEGRVFAILGDTAPDRHASELDALRWLTKLFETDLPTHVAEIFMEIVKLYGNQPQRKGGADAREEGPEAADSREP